MPEKYYLDYFNYVLDFVERQYNHVLDAPEYAFYQAFRDLSEDAQCLYIRLSNRRGNYFRMSKIVYPEIQNLKSAKEELLYQAFIDINESHDTQQFTLFTKHELTEIFDFLENRLRKFELLEHLDEMDIYLLHQADEIVEVKKNDEVEFIKLLFFGNKEGQMTDFVVRDVGNVRIEALDESKFSPWFQSREEALAVLHVSKLKKLIREAIKADFPITSFLEDIPWERWLSHPKSNKPTAKLLFEIGYFLEQTNNLDEALTYYQYTPQHPSRERIIRILQKLGRADEALSVAQKIISDTNNASEYTFALDFLNKSGVRIDRSMTRMLKNAPTVDVKRSSQRVEQDVLEYFRDEGWEGFHTENFVWRGIFGLLFWDEIFDENYGSFHHPLQRQPSDLNDNFFYQSRAEAIQLKSNRFKSRKQLIRYLLEVHERKKGMANRFVTWHEVLPNQVQQIISALPLKGLMRVMIEMAKNMKENSTGFPDLFLWNERTYHFYEVKSPNDHLSAQRLFWINFLKEQKIKADVLRVNYKD